MWNSDSPPKDDISQQVNNMSAALNLSTDCLQQFMAGNVSIEKLAAMKPYGNSKNSPNEPVSNTLCTPHRIISSNLFPTLPSETSLSNVLSSSMSTTVLQSSNQVSDTISEDVLFRSQFSSESSNFMELSTVTPSRIRNSPSAIVAKGISYKPTVLSKDDAPGTSKIVTPLHSIPAIETTPVRSTASGIDYDDHFQIIIGDNNSPEQTVRKYFLDLNTVSKDKENSNEEDNLQKESTKSDSEDGSGGGSGSDEAEKTTTTTEQANLIGKPERKKKKKDSSTKIPKHLRGLMGEANLTYARGAHDDAIKMCMEVIRHAPYAAEPYVTLSMIYDERGENVKSLQYSLLAAHLSRTSASQWLHLAGMCITQGDMEKAIACYTKASKASPSDRNIHAECGKLCLQQGQLHKGISHYKDLVMLMSSEEGDAAVELARDLSKMCHSEGQNLLGIGLLEQAFESHSSHFKDEDANLLCELYVMEKETDRIFKLLSRHSGLSIEFDPSVEFPDYTKITKLTVPTEMAVDLISKVAIAAIQMGKSELVEDIVRSVCAHNPADTGDIQYELAEALIAESKYAEALVILDILVNSHDYSLAGVWLRHGECHRLLGNFDSALVSYKNCVRLAPGHVQAHVMYSKMLRKADKYSQAIQTLDSAENYEIDPDEHVKLCYERYKVHKAWTEKSKKRKVNLSYAADAALTLFVNKFKQSAFKEARIYLIRRTRPSNNPMAGELKLIQCRHKHLPDESTLTESDLYFNSNYDICVTKEKWMEFFQETISLLLRCRRFPDGIALCEGMLYHYRWGEHPPTRRRFEHVNFCICMISGKYQLAYTILSPWIRSNPDSNMLWNTFNLLIAKTGDQRHQKFCLRLLDKYPQNVSLLAVASHNWMVSGFYRTALGEYLYCHKQVPDEPLYIFMAGVAFVNLCSQKFTDFKHSFAAHSLAYLQKYLELRGLNQESYYNIGRAMHQLGLEHFAIHYYEMALMCSPPQVVGVDAESIYGLRREIAFNMSLIYRKNGNDSIANDILFKHCTV